MMYAMQGEAGRNRVEPSLELAVENDGGTARNGGRKKYICEQNCVVRCRVRCWRTSVESEGVEGDFSRPAAGDPANQSLIRRESRLRRESLKFFF